MGKREKNLLQLFRAQDANRTRDVEQMTRAISRRRCVASDSLARLSHRLSARLIIPNSGVKSSRLGTDAQHTSLPRAELNRGTSQGIRGRCAAKNFTILKKNRDRFLPLAFMHARRLWSTGSINDSSAISFRMIIRDTKKYSSRRSSGCPMAHLFDFPFCSPSSPPLSHSLALHLPPSVTRLLPLCLVTHRVLSFKYGISYFLTTH